MTAAVLLVGNASGRPALAVAVGVVQAAFVAGWLVSFAATLDAAVLVVIGVAVADVVLLRTRTATGGSIAGVIGVSVIAVLFHQLVRRDPRGVTSAVALTLAAIILGAAPALLLPLRELPVGRSAGFVALLASGAALVVVRLPVAPDLPRRVAALGVGIAAALLCGLGKGGLTTGHAAAMGACCVVTVLLADRLLVRIAVEARPPSAGWPAAVTNAAVAAILPLALACPVAYLVGRVIAPGAG
ncbi:MAG TPA: hypothetical protein VHZ96_10045 [Frankiaceae bacterium]|nr:hypothetical protein [Frankiaceae bacterium]